MNTVIADFVRHATRDAPEMSEARKSRHEKVLVAMLDRNMTRTGLAHTIGFAAGTVSDDCSHLVGRGMVTTWLAKSGTVRQRWYGLTKPGERRAKELQEMEHGHH